MNNSKQAHEDLKKSGRKEALHMQIMRYMYRYGEATFSDLSKYYGVHDSVYWKRLSELAKAGLIVKTNRNKISNTTGKFLTVWALK